ncbi:iron-siderophore ABC transporter substrate-binding protein [Bacillaceae bacterium SIJ1]|uniref:ABC transporter substrate-binding protein n=1 Tax=Litoribacterium kuwaitense TaxID=1398745 RepID=UPI0013EB69A7|nr:iron-siderophore ABC transporter substrate-binding protein [Litoribacterium kuwaitense]NGP46402.1 iron-siderophore ABC transporter substrate-binding protein [Litoribacterium kuwaitense]
MKKLLVLMLTFLLTLTACAEQGTDQTGTPDDQNKNEEQIAIEHALGTATFDDVPQTIVVLEWNYVEELLALGVQPAGVADIEGFEKWVDIEAELNDDVVDVGTRTEPNLEEIAKLEPDAIITIASSHEKIQAELETIAPTIFYDSTSEEATKDLYAYTFETFQKTASLVQKEAEAEQALNDLEAKYEEAAKDIEAMDLPTNTFVFTQAYSANNTPTFRLFTKNAMVSRVLEKAGLENAITDHQDAAWGFTDANVEGLAQYEDALLIHAVQEDDPLFENLESNKAWQELQFVKEGHMVDIGGDTWTFGGVLSAHTLVDNLLESLKEE